jgi:hypothetical protein
MHRPLIIPALVLLLAPLPLLAQRGGGGHGSAGGHGGGFASHGSFGGGGHAFSGGHAGSGFAGHSSAPRSFSGRSLSGRSLSGRSFAGRNYARGSFNRGARGHGRSGTGLRIRTYGYGNRCFGYPCRGGYGYPWGYYGGYDPYWWGDSDSSYDQDQQDQVGLAEEMNQQSLADQQTRQQSDQNGYAQPAPRPHQPERTEAVSPTVLVFRDQHKQEVENYAIVGQTLWNFAPQRTEKIPLSELDIPATTKANEDRGVSFRLPGGQEGQ